MSRGRVVFATYKREDKNFVDAMFATPSPPYDLPTSKPSLAPLPPAQIPTLQASLLPSHAPTRSTIFPHPLLPSSFPPTPTAKKKIKKSPSGAHTLLPLSLPHSPSTPTPHLAQSTSTPTSHPRSSQRPRVRSSSSHAKPRPRTLHSPSVRLRAPPRAPGRGEAHRIKFPHLVPFHIFRREGRDACS